MSGFAKQPILDETARTTIRRAATILRDYAASMADFRVSSCENIASEQFVCGEGGRRINETFFGWSGERQQWWTIKGVTFLSPAMLGARYESEPFWCNRFRFFTRTPNPALSSVDLSKIERYTGRKAAMVVPVRLPFGRIAAVGFHPNDPERQDLSTEFEKYADHLERLSWNFILSFIKCVEAPAQPEAYPLLNTREVECLQWAAGGKTDSEIAQIIARSHATIRFHVRRAMEKLNAVNRGQAIFRAAQLGYLTKVPMQTLHR